MPDRRKGDWFRPIVGAILLALLTNLAQYIIVSAYSASADAVNNYWVSYVNNYCQKEKHSPNSK